MEKFVVCHNNQLHSIFIEKNMDVNNFIAALTCAIGIPVGNLVAFKNKKGKHIANYL